MTERTTGIPDDSPDNTVLKMLMIMEEEATDSGAVFTIEKDEKGNINRTMVTSLKLNQRTFRITISWVRDECLAQGFSGWAYIETDWDLKLHSQADSVPPKPSYYWSLIHKTQKSPPFSLERTLDGPLLRSLIREKLGVPPRT